MFARIFSEKTLHVDHDGMFSVSRERFGRRRFFLDVLCGGLGMFERRLEMTNEEIEAFRRDPGELKTLAGQVARWPERFGDRLCLR